MQADSPKVKDLPAAASPALVGDLTAGFRETAEEVVPWFLSNLPPMYFQDTDHATQLTHLRAIIAARASGRPLELTLRNEDGTEWTSMRPHNRPGALADMVSELPEDVALRAAKIHTATDGNLVLNTFEFGADEPFSRDDPRLAERLAEAIRYAAEHDPPYTAEEITAHCERCTIEYLLTVTPLRLCEHLELFRTVSGTDGSAVGLETESDPDMCRIVVAVANVTTRRMLERIATRVAHSKINVHRAYLDVIQDGDNGSITLLGFVAQGPDGTAIDPGSDLWAELSRDLKHSKWVDHRTLDLAYANPGVGMIRGEIITGLCALVHQVLVKQNAYAFSQDRVLRLAARGMAPAASIADLFLARFDPAGPLDDAAFDAADAKIRCRIAKEVDLEDSRIVLRSMLDAVRAVLRTNIYLESRYGLGMRLDPAFLVTEERPELPFGVFFVHGRGFNGFHVRFRDIARGGLRVVRTRNEEQHALESERLYDEAYNLAFAQQLKNKDIPEGGAKAAVLLDPPARIDRAVKGFVDSLLDLITPEPRTRQRVVDLLGQDELLYLGPDENITPVFIEWIVDRAAQRGYPLPTALMSSKPGAGINHKEYGVTSEGVTVFLDVALRSLGFDPANRPFTLKMTGGPDGDVGGNLIRLLAERYGKNARIVGISDGSGSGEDPAGLDLDELVRLAKEGLPIIDFDRKKLGSGGRIIGVDEPGGVQQRNTLHNRVIADAFVPCGGRPSTIHAGNFEKFLGPDGAPSSRVIVEGANLFLTPEARQELSDRGALILKDSSANKCGVITSSYEIISNMLLSEEEFLRIKERFVAEVLEKLRTFARREAELLVRLHRHHPQVPLPKMSTRLSLVMIRTADAIEAALDRFGEEDHDRLRRLVVDHLPAVLVEVAGDRLWEKTPPAYLNWIMAKSLSTRIVYREGFEYIDPMPTEVIASLAVRYLKLELERSALAEEIERSDLPRRDRVAAVLRRSGILSMLEDRGEAEEGNLL